MLANLDELLLDQSVTRNRAGLQWAPRRSRAALAAGKVIAESPVDAARRLDPVVAIVPIAQAVGDRVGVVEGRRQFVSCSLHQVDLPAPFVPMTIVSFGRWSPRGPSPFVWLSVSAIPGTRRASKRERRIDTTPTFILNENEMAELDGEALTGGGFQDLTRRLQLALDRQTGEIEVADEDVERIRRYCTYGQGGWQDPIARAFRRVLNVD